MDTIDIGLNENSWSPEQGTSWIQVGTVMDTIDIVLS